MPLTLFFKAIFVDSDPRTAWIDVFFRPSDEPTSLVVSRKFRDRDGDDLDDATGKPRSIDTRLREEQIQDAAEKERARAQATLEALNQEALEQAAQKAEKDKANKAEPCEKTEE